MSTSSSRGAIADRRVATHCHSPAAGMDIGRFGSCALIVLFSLLTTLSDHRSAVVQDAWERIRKESFERTRAEEDASCDDIAELAKCTQAQLNNIARECSDSVFRLRSSMSGDVDVLRREVEAVQGQMDALKQDLASQLHELSAAAVTPGILAAAIAAMEKHANQYLPARSIILHSPAAGLLIARPGLKPASSVA